LRENPELRVEIENKVRDSLGVPLLPVDEVSPEPKAAKAPKVAKEPKEPKEDKALAE
jgi:recombination protein RecA